MKVLLSMVIVALFVGCVSPGSMPSLFTACSASDPELNQCIEKQITLGGPEFADGIPSLGIAPLDPLHLGRVDVDNPALKLVFTDTVVTGLKGFRLNSYKMNKALSKAAIDFTANVTLKAHYDIDGQLLILAIRGSGPAKIKITNLNIVIKYDLDTRDGHWVVTDYKDTYKMDKAMFKFTNLFGGNKQLADTTSRFTNENWEVIMQEIAPPAINSIIKSCVGVVNKFFENVPRDELLLP